MQNSKKKQVKKITKKSRKTSRKKSGALRHKLHFFGILLTGFLCFSAGFLTYKGLDYFFGQNLSEKSEPSKEKVETKKPEVKDREEILKPIKKLEQNLTQPIIDSNLSELNATIDNNITLDKNNTDNNLSIYEIDDIEKLEAVKPTPSSKPKLVIIIDDVSTMSDITNMKSTNLKLTPSIFPPNKNKQNTPNLAKQSEFHMVHLPLEAQSYSDSLKTLKVADNYDTMDKFIKDIRTKFPNAKFINNHTGSKFTANQKAMERLYIALERYGFIFVDSKTIASTKVKEAAKKSGHKYVGRDIFLDNEANEKAVKAQLKKAADIAKKRGYAIAIGHPKNATFKALKNSKDILEGVEVVYLKDIYEYY